MGTLVNAQNIRGVYHTDTGKDFVAVNDVSITIDEGEVLGLAGESGSGKTTLGSIISLIARPPLHVEQRLARDRRQGAGAGSRRQDPADLARIRGLHAAAGCDELGQSHRPDPRPGLRRDAGPRQQDQQDEALDRARDRINTLGLPPRVLDAYPHQLSGGMKQRTVTIISTLLNPRLLIADEPTSALDVTSQKILIEMLLDMLEKGIMSGVIFVTHDLPVLRTVATKIAMMYQGQVVESGPTEQMVDDPSHPYTQALLGSVLVPEQGYNNTRIEGMANFDRDSFLAPAVIR